MRGTACLPACLTDLESEEEREIAATAAVASSEDGGGDVLAQDTE